MGGRLGPYTVVETVILAPSVELVDARSGEGDRFLLQVARLRAATDEADKDARTAFEKSIAQKTSGFVVDEPDLGIHAHGGTDGPDGTRVLFWALDWPDRPIVGAALTNGDEEAIFTPRQVLQIGLDLARRMERRHPQGHSEPLLSEHLIVVPGPERSAELVGVPISIPAEWAATEVAPARLAPEEETSQIPTSSGDFWRLGRALETLATAMTPESKAVADCIESLAHHDPSQRVSSPEDAVEWIEMSLESLDVETKATDSDVPTHAGPASEDDEDEVFEDPDPSEAHTKQTAFGDVLTEEHVLADAEAAKDPLQAVTDPAAVSYRATMGEPSVEAAAAAWAAPVLPVGASPWSEVVSAQGTHTRAHSDFTGFSEELPGVTPEALGPRPSRPVSPLPVPGTADPLNLEADPELVAALSGFNGKKVVFGVVALLLIFGFFLMISRPQPEPIAALTSVRAHPFNAVQLDAHPKDAVVVSEADGRTLAGVPLEFLVPDDSSAAVLVWAPGHEAQRVVLPDRGRITINLLPVSSSSCQVPLTAPGRATLEGVGFDMGEASAAKIPGAAIVRATDDSKVAGARIVRCPALGGLAGQTLDLVPRWSPATVSLSAPEGARAEIDGKDLGKIPAQGFSKSAFTRVQIKDSTGNSLERWVPTRTDTDVHMPVLDGQLAVADEYDLVAAPPLVPPSVAPRRVRRRSAQQLLQSGSRDLMAGRMRRAKTTLKECVRSHPQSADCHRVLGTLYAKTSSSERANQHFRKYLELRPNAPDASTIRKMLGSNAPR